MWRVCVLGHLSIQGNGGPVIRVPNRRVGALLGVLALNPERTWQRDELASLFWPDHDQASGRRNLRQAVFVLRQLLHDAMPDAPELVHGDEQAIWVQSDALTTDLQSFAAGLSSEDATEWAAAERLYDGPLLKDFSNTFIDGERVRIEAEFLQLLRRLIKHEYDAGRVETAIQYAQKAVKQDPLNERNQFTLLRLYARNGQFPAAKRQYATFERLLADELHAQPSRPLAKLLASPGCQTADVALPDPARAETGALNRRARGFSLSSWAWGAGFVAAVTFLVSMALARGQFAPDDYPTLRAQLKTLLTQPESGPTNLQQAQVIARIGELAWADAYEAREDTWQNELEPLLPEIKRVQTWCVKHDPRSAVQIGGAFTRYFLLAGQEGQWADLLQQAIVNGRAEDSAMFARAYVAVGIGRPSRTDPQMRAQLDRALTFYRDRLDRWGEAHTLRIMGFVAASTGHTDDAIRAYKEALAINEDIDCTSGVALCTLCLSLVHAGSDNMSAEENRQAAEWATESLRAFQKLGNHWGIPFATTVMTDRVSGLPASETKLIREGRDLLEVTSQFEGRWHNLLAVGACLQNQIRLSLKVKDVDQAATALMRLASSTYLSQLSWDKRYVVMVAAKRLDGNAFDAHGGSYFLGVALKRVGEQRGDAYADRVRLEAQTMPLDDCIAVGLAGFLE